MRGRACLPQGVPPWLPGWSRKRLILIHFLRWDGAGSPGGSNVPRLWLNDHTCESQNGLNNSLRSRKGRVCRVGGVMKNELLVGALLAAASGSAMAADLPVSPGPAPAPAYSRPAAFSGYNWSGLYL